MDLVCESRIFCIIKNKPAESESKGIYDIETNHHQAEGEKTHSG